MTNKQEIALLEEIDRLNERIVDLEDELGHLEHVNDKLETENTELKQMNKTLLIHNTEFALGVPEIIKENDKLKKAIEILKYTIILPMENDIARVDINGNNHYLLSFVKRLISEQEYELLKEVLEC